MVKLLTVNFGIEMRIAQTLSTIVLVMPLAGCDLDSFWEEWNKGTTKGFSYCRIAGAKQGLSERVVRTYCAARHQRPIVVELSGSALYNVSANTLTGFSGTIFNESSDTIVTEYRITIVHKQATERELKIFSDRWLEPRATEHFVLPLNDLKYKPAPGDATNKDAFEWDIVGIKGIRLSF